MRYSRANDYREDPEAFRVRDLRVRRDSVKCLFMADDTDKQRGKVVERLIADLSSMFFMKDFVLRNPFYVTSGQEREVTDLIFLLNQDCMIVSVKGTDGRDKSADRLPLWARKKVWEASKNAKTALQRVAKLEIKATNLWDETRTFAAGTLRPICGLALVECSQEMFAPITFAVKQPTGSGAFNRSMQHHLI